MTSYSYTIINKIKSISHFEKVYVYKNFIIKVNNKFKIQKMIYKLYINAYIAMQTSGDVAQW